MEVSMVERTMQEDMRWSEGLVSDMCMPDNADLQRSEIDLQYFDENTWEELDSAKVVAAERAELKRFEEMGVYERVPRAEALNDPEGKFVKVKWVRTNKGWDTDNGWTRCSPARRRSWRLRWHWRMRPGGGRTMASWSWT